MRSTAQLRAAWSPPCRLQTARFPFWTGVQVVVDQRAVEALQALDAVFRNWNYGPRAGETWGYACRRITGGTGYSLHAYGATVDVNSLANPYGPRLVTDMPREMVNAALAIRTNGGHEVWGWGGNYRRNKDAMHYECVASPQELATGINWNTVRGTPPPTPPPIPDGAPPWPGRVLKQPPIMRGDDVRQWQQQMAKRGWRLEVDGAYGTGTENVCRKFQAEKGLKVDGKVGPSTWTATWTAAVT